MALIGAAMVLVALHLKASVASDINALPDAYRDARVALGKADVITTVVLLAGVVAISMAGIGWVTDASQRVKAWKHSVVGIVFLLAGSMSSLIGSTIPGLLIGSFFMVCGAVASVWIDANRKP